MKALKLHAFLKFLVMTKKFPRTWFAGTTHNKSRK